MVQWEDVMRILLAMAFLFGTYGTAIAQVYGPQQWDANTHIDPFDDYLDSRLLSIAENGDALMFNCVFTDNSRMVTIEIIRDSDLIFAIDGDSDDRTPNKMEFKVDSNPVDTLPADTHFPSLDDRFEYVRYIAFAKEGAFNGDGNFKNISSLVDQFKKGNVVHTRVTLNNGDTRTTSFSLIGFTRNFNKLNDGCKSLLGI